MENNTSKLFAESLRKVDSIAVSVTRNGGTPLFLHSSCGVKVSDVDNNSFIDCTSFFGVLGIGHRHPKVIEAVKYQADLITHTMVEIEPHDIYPKALEKILEVVGRTSTSQVLMTTSGSEAVEVALKLAYTYTKKPGVISFTGAFHGQTIGALSVTSQNCFRDPFYPLISNNVVFVEYPNLYRSDANSESQLVQQTINQLDSIVNSGHSGGLPIGAVIIEPFQNSSGYIVPPSGFIPKLKEFCSNNQILLIADEIFTGFGRCGKWLSFDYESVVADIICVGKVMGGGLPSSACIAPKEIMESMSDGGLVPLHGSTFQGNPLSCAATIATIDTIKSENLVDKSYALGVKFREELTSVFGELDVVGQIRGQGSATAIEFVTDKASKRRNPSEALRFSEYLLSRGIITLITGVPYGNSVAFCPPFIMDDQTCQYIFSVCEDYAKKQK